ncbi:uncharacterized protein LOC125186431 isoform X2 [Salvia hispanica]|uniref:uncharacterized protein LOC125186431 isoform X2 n=1 Tax=Salvia hispanica TaxID=49212 RepID=UPI0020095BAB|nr:uncharacterized protein LOC125186431 isoform X2 [Salvia hispanica]
MDSPQLVVSPLKSSFPESEKQHTADKSSHFSREINFQKKGSAVGNLEEFVGALEVYIHQARDIHNICIYQKQDVYAKLCLTSDPEKTVSTKIINGGGANPIFNENLSLNIRKVDSSLKCEIWMLSRVRNYLEDQLLGFALVPISEVFLNNGFVQLSVTYIGVQPEVIPIPAPPTYVETDSMTKDTESTKSVPDDMDKIEFPDPNVANENHQMVEEYFGMPCSNVDSPSSDSLVSSDTENQVSSEIEVQHEESFSMRTTCSRPTPKVDSPPSSTSTNGGSSASAPVSFQSSETLKDSKSPGEELVSLPKDKSKEKIANGVDVDSNASGGVSSDTSAKPVITVPEPKVVQQDIVDMYMKSMQQFTESLAKMKLPMDFENGPTSSENSTSSGQKTPGSKNSGSRVFYGSRAFF